MLVFGRLWLLWLERVFGRGDALEGHGYESSNSGDRDYQDKDPRNESSMEVRLVGAKCVDKNESQPIQEESGKQVALFS